MIPAEEGIVPKDRSLEIDHNQERDPGHDQIQDLDRVQEKEKDFL